MGSFGYIKIEDSPSPEQTTIAVEPLPSHELTSPVNPRDPEGFLKRCSGFNKKTKLRCSSSIGSKSQQDCHPTFLPTCKSHRYQQNFAGWCQYQHPNSQRCGRLFRWTPPYFELCSEHLGHPNTPCYFTKLPLELRHEIFRYILPSQPIGSSTAALHDGQGDAFDHAYVINAPMIMTPHHRHSIPTPYQPANTLTRRPDGSRSIFPVPLLDLLLVNRQIYHEVKDLLFSTAVFTIDVRKDGTFMCGRRLLEPRRADGSSHYLVDDADEAKQRFLKTFDFSSVKHYAVDILVENWADQMMFPNRNTWDEEVEIYDIRDYVSVVVSGVLAKSHRLCKLQVRLCFADFDWSLGRVLESMKLLVGPFESLRNVLQPQLAGVYMGRPYHNSMLSVQRPVYGTGSMAPICSVPLLPTRTPVVLPGLPDFDTFATTWARCISTTSARPITEKPPIRSMFTEFKDFYSKLSEMVPDVTFRKGKHAFLHRARVAREHEDVESFRNLRNELIQYWDMYIEREEQKRRDMNARLSRMLDSDAYPSHEWEEYSDKSEQGSSKTGLCSQSPILLNATTMAKEGIPMTGNPTQRIPGTEPYPGFNCNGGQVPTLTKGASPREQQQYSQLMMMLEIQNKKNLKSITAEPTPPGPSTQGKTGVKAKIPTHPISDDYESHNIKSQKLPELQIVSDEHADISQLKFPESWYADDTSEAGPSTKRRKLDPEAVQNSIKAETCLNMAAENVLYDSFAHDGKGKGKMAMGVICVD